MSSFSHLLGERQFISQYANDTVGFILHVNGVQADPDGDVTLTILNVDDTYLIDPDDDGGDPPVPVPNTGSYKLETTREEEGVFSLLLTSLFTQTPGIYKLLWEYELGSDPQSFMSIIEVGPSSAFYDSLSDEFKDMVESVWLKMADMFDSPYGGPHLQVYFQTSFSRATVAKLMGDSLGRLNVIAQPVTTYTLGPEEPVFPLEIWGAVLHQSTWVEVIKHMQRSYLEQPTAMNVTVSRLDRRDYMQRWGDILRTEQEDLQDMLSEFKKAHMGLGRPRVLVSGGVYGKFGPRRTATGGGAHRGYFWHRGH